MFVSTAYAQGAGGAGGGGLEALLPLVLIFVVFYFLLIRPQQKKMKQHREMLSQVRRKDKVVTGGGIVGTITKVDSDHELTVEIAKGVEVKIQRDTIAMVLSKTEPQAGKTPQAANEDKPQGGLLGKLFGGGAKPPAAANEAALAKAEEPAAEAPADAKDGDQAADGKDGDQAADAKDGDAPEKKSD